MRKRDIVRNGSLKVKIGAFAVFIMLAVSVVYTLVSLRNIIVQQRYALNKQQSLMLADYDEKIQWEVQNVISLLKTYDELYSKEGLPFDERQKRVKEIVRGLRYGTEGYFWIDTFDGVNVLLPPRPDTEGTNRLDWTDEDGKRMVRDFIEIGKSDVGGFTDFKFPKLGSDKPEPKRSYTAPFRPYQWVVGTGNYIDDIDKALAKERAGFEVALRSTLFNQIILSVVAVVASCIVFVYIIMRIFVRPIVRITNNFRDISEGNGDLTARLNVAGNDEISRLCEYFNRTIEKIRTAIEHIKNNASEMQLLGTSLARNADGTAMEISQIVSNIDSINHQIDEQGRGVLQAGDSIDAIAKSISELDSKIEEQSASVSEASGAVTQMLGNIAQVNDSVEKMAHSFNTLSQNAGIGVNKQKDVNERILQIDEQSRMLHEANKVISSIASQTNLLAMNAAIEAAHAGDAGKGFAVVADEIRKLSETSSAQSETIGKQLRNIRNSISGVVVASTEASGAFSAVSEQIGETETLVRSIKFAMDEQNQGSRRIGNSLADVNEKAVQVTSASKDIDGRNAQILGEMQRLREATEAVRQGVEGITIGARRIGDSGNGLAKSSAAVRDAIGDISEQISMFKVS